MIDTDQFVENEDKFEEPEGAQKSDGWTCAYREAETCIIHCVENCAKPVLQREELKHNVRIGDGSSKLGRNNKNPESSQANIL